MEMQSGRRCTEFYDPRSRHVWEGAQHGAFLQKSPVFLSARRSSWVGPCSGQKGDESDEYLFGVGLPWLKNGQKRVFCSWERERDWGARSPQTPLVGGVSHPTSISPPYSNYLLTVNPSAFLLPICTYCCCCGVAASLPPSVFFFIPLPPPSLPRPHSSLDSSGSVE